MRAVASIAIAASIEAASTLIVNHRDGSLHAHDLERRRPSRAIDGLGHLNHRMAGKGIERLRPIDRDTRDPFRYRVKNIREIRRHNSSPLFHSEQALVEFLL